MKSISRRTALKGSTAVAVCTAAAVAASAALPAGAEPEDPLLAMEREWLDVQHEYVKRVELHDIDDDELTLRQIDLEIQIVETPATTLQGVAAKARVACGVTGEGYEKTGPDPGGIYSLADDRVLWSLHKDLERLVEEAAS